MQFAYLNPAPPAADWRRVGAGFTGLSEDRNVIALILKRELRIPALVAHLAVRNIGYLPPHSTTPIIKVYLTSH